MSTHKIKIIINGIEEESGHVLINPFIDQLRAYATLIRKTEGIIMGGSGKSSFHLRVVALSHSSPIEAVLEGVPLVPEYDVCVKVLDSVIPIIKAASNGGVGQYAIDSDYLSTLNDVASRVGTKVGPSRLERNGDTFDVTSDVCRKMDALLAEETSCDGDMTGVFEYLNIHDNQNVFRIYPDSGASKINCRFPDELRDEAIKAVGSYVEVGGRLLFRSMDYHPHAIEVERIYIMPDEDDLPTLMDLRGIAPDLTGGLNAIEFVKKIRNA